MQPLQEYQIIKSKPLPAGPVTHQIYMRNPHHLDCTSYQQLSVVVGMLLGIGRSAASGFLFGQWGCGFFATSPFTLSCTRSFPSPCAGGCGWVMDTAGYRGGSILQELSCWPTTGLFWAPDLHLRPMLLNVVKCSLTYLTKRSKRYTCVCFAF